MFSIILISASLIAGLSGMNVPIPGAESKGSFWVLLASMAVLAGARLVFFKRRRWV